MGLYVRGHSSITRLASAPGWCPARSNGASTTAAEKSGEPAASSTSAKCSAFPMSRPIHTSMSSGVPTAALFGCFAHSSGRPQVRSPSSTLRISDQSHVPVRGSRTEQRRWQHPAGRRATGGTEPCRRCRTSRSQTLLRPCRENREAGRAQGREPDPALAGAAASSPPGVPVGRLPCLFWKDTRIERGEHGRAHGLQHSLRG